MNEESELSEFEFGLFVGILIGEGHFGDDGRQPQITLHMHTEHESLFERLTGEFPGGRLYGPYAHGGRRYFQRMARGPVLRDVIVPSLDRHLRPAIDEKANGRYQQMKERYRL